MFRFPVFDREHLTSPFLYPTLRTRPLFCPTSRFRVVAFRSPCVCAIKREHLVKREGRTSALRICIVSVTHVRGTYTSPGTRSALPPLHGTPL